MQNPAASVTPRRLVYACVLFFLAAMQLQGEKPFDFAATPGKLPKQVVPLEYRVRIVPNVEAKTFAGTAIIKIKVTAPVRQVVLNALELEVSGAMVDEQALSASAIKIDKK